MYLTAITLCLVIVPLYALPSSAPVLTQDGDVPNFSLPVVKNANHIFNTIHSSMRQWGSSLNHNGMSFFLAHIPAGTELFHGRGDRNTVTGMDWLAFEPEHAMNFAMKVIMKPPPPDDQEASPELGSSASSECVAGGRHQADTNLPSGQGQKLLNLFHRFNTPKSTNKKPPPRHGPPRLPLPHKLLPGWLHTYRMKEDLRVIYIDGEAAAKSRKGTTDTQQYVLAFGHVEDDPIWGPPDYEIALHMCSLAEEEWGGQIDGFIRMEHGFELILCDFERHADLVRMNKVDLDLRSGIMLKGGVRLMTFLHAIGARYHSIGGERVRVHYDNFVTSFATDINLFHDDSGLPRLNNITSEQRTALLKAISDLVTITDLPLTTINWQSITDMITTRYSDPLHVFAFDEFRDKEELDYLISLLQSPFIDYDNRNTTLEISRCAKHFIPEFPPDSIAGIAILEASTQVCSNLFAAINDHTLAQAQSRFIDLINWLQWTTWKECRPGCSYDEFCLTAIWPIGDKESHQNPFCVTIESLKNHTRGTPEDEGYWDFSTLARSKNNLPVNPWL